MLIVKKAQCPLCDEALALLNRMRRRLRLDVRVADISHDGTLLEVYGNEVPVVFIEDRKRFFGHVDLALLRREVEAVRARRRD